MLFLRKDVVDGERVSREREKEIIEGKCGRKKKVFCSLYYEYNIVYWFGFSRCRMFQHGMAVGKKAMKYYFV